MTKDEFLELFEGNPQLCQAAEEWWGNVETCTHPYARLWFLHWRHECRARPQIALAFQQAFELGTLSQENALGYMACDVFGRLFQACKQEVALAKTMGLCSGPLIDRNESDVPSVTYIEIDLPEPAFDCEIEEAVRTESSLRNDLGTLAVTWVTPVEDIPGNARQSETDIDIVRDRLGLPHWQKLTLKAALLWPSSVTSNAHVPTILDGRWAFWAPAPEGSVWGRTLGLSSGEPALREGVVQGDRTEWELAAENGSPCRWHLKHAYDPGHDGRYADLCERLLAAAETAGTPPSPDGNGANN